MVFTCPLYAFEFVISNLGSKHRYHQIAKSRNSEPVSQT